VDIRGFRGAYLVNAILELAGRDEKEWSLVADVNQDSSQVAALIHALKTNPDGLSTDLQQDIDKSSADLQKIVASADGLQFSADELNSTHHFANVLFNTMRVGFLLKITWLGGMICSTLSVSAPNHLTEADLFLCQSPRKGQLHRTC